MLMATQRDVRLRTTTLSERDTRELARALAGALEPGDVLALIGPLGAGKTCFVRGLARALGVPESVPVHSPSFTLLHVYEGRVPVYHFDLYRLSDEDDLEAVGYRDALDGVGICVVEWADRIPSAAPPVHLEVAIELLEGDGRLITLSPVGWSAERCGRLAEAVAGAATEAAPR